jgi:hypothetical protein
MLERYNLFNCEQRKTHCLSNPLQSVSTFCIYVVHEIIIGRWYLNGLRSLKSFVTFEQLRAYQ